MLTAVAAAVLASLLTAFLLRAATVGLEVSRHDRLIAELNEDLRRWIRDADRERNVLLERAGVQPGLGEPGESLADIAELFRQRWRDEASRRLRSFWAIAESEGRLHEVLRRSGESRPMLELSRDATETLARWREPRVGNLGKWGTMRSDPADAENEPEIAAFESGGSVLFPRRRLFSGTARVAETP